MARAGGGLGAFVRSLVNLDRDAENDALFETELTHGIPTDVAAWPEVNSFTPQ
ncbi:MAG: hypothetical protein ACRDTG_17835 [Pseudonocardiaceae bacterium]